MLTGILRSIKANSGKTRLYIDKSFANKVFLAEHSKIIDIVVNLKKRWTALDQKKHFTKYV